MNVHQHLKRAEQAILAVAERQPPIGDLSWASEYAASIIIDQHLAQRESMAEALAAIHAAGIAHDDAMQSAEEYDAWRDAGGAAGDDGDDWPFPGFD